MVNELQKNKNKINLIKKTFIFFLILIIFSPIFIAFQQSSSGLQELKSCETYHSALQINSEKVFKLSQLNREFSKPTLKEELVPKPEFFCKSP